MLHDSTEEVDYKKMITPQKIIRIRIISAQQLSSKSEINKDKKVKDVVDPYIKVYSRGLEQDEKQEYKTKTVSNNGFNPIFDNGNVFEFKFCCPELGFLIFEANDHDYIGSDEILGWEAIPVNCILPGYRIINLRDHNLQIMQSSCILCHISIKN